MYYITSLEKQRSRKMPTLYSDSIPSSTVENCCIDCNSSSKKPVVHWQRTERRLLFAWLAPLLANYLPRPFHRRRRRRYRQFLYKLLFCQFYTTKNLSYCMLYVSVYWALVFILLAHSFAAFSTLHASFDLFAFFVLLRFLPFLPGFNINMVTLDAQTV